MVFAGLLLIAVIIIINDSGTNERSFRAELVDIDTSAVSRVVIFPKKAGVDEVDLLKENDDGWKVKLSSGKYADVPKSKMDQLFNQLMSVKPNRLAARGESSWKEFEVDSAGTRVQVFEGNDKTLDLIIGRFSFQQPRTMNTFVRLANDADVYEVDGFLGMTFNQDASSFRNGTIIKGEPGNWMNVAYTYPADSSFQLIKVNDKWQTASGEPVDSAETVNFLRQLSSRSGNKFVEVNENELPGPDMTLEIKKADGGSIVVNAYKIKGQYILNSSQNPDTYFDGGNNDLWKKIFVGLSKFQKR